MSSSKVLIMDDKWVIHKAAVSAPDFEIKQNPCPLQKDAPPKTLKLLGRFQGEGSICLESVI
jgi:hypothetical protein